MKRFCVATTFVFILILSVVSVVNADMVTVTHPDGTVVEMTLEDYRSLFLNNSSTSATAATQEDTETTDAAPWPSYTLLKYPLEPVLLAEPERKMGYLGPSRNYAESDAYKPYKMARTEGLFIEGSYVFVDMNYPTVGVRRTYFSRGTFQSTSGVPEVTLTGYPAKTTQSVLPRYGPGLIYDPFPDASVTAGTALTVFFEENGYVFTEYQVGFELVRAWIASNSVAP